MKFMETLEITFGIRFYCSVLRACVLLSLPSFTHQLGVNQPSRMWLDQRASLVMVHMFVFKIPS